MSQDNSAQRDAWNGQTGNSWSQFQDLLDTMMQPVTAELIPAADLKAGEGVLDIGCGTGPTTIAAARAVAPKGHAVGVDISGLLLQSARERSAKLGLPLTWIEADAATYKFTEKFDKIVSRFGVMFFADPVAAFQNIKSALSPSGKMTFVCWRSLAENKWIAEVMALAAKIMPLPPPATSYAPGPFGFADRNFLNGVLTKAGFKAIDIKAFDPELLIPGETVPERMGFYMRMGPTAGILREASDEQRARLESTIKDWVAENFAAGRKTHGGACWLVRASV